MRHDRADRCARPRPRPGCLRELLPDALSRLHCVRTVAGITLRRHRPASTPVPLAAGHGDLRPLQPGPPPQACWPGSPVCDACYNAALRHRGTCAACGQVRWLVTPPGTAADTCARCAGIPVICATSAGYWPPAWCRDLAPEQTAAAVLLRQLDFHAQELALIDRDLDADARPRRPGPRLGPQTPGAAPVAAAACGCASPGPWRLGLPSSPRPPDATAGELGTATR